MNHNPTDRAPRTAYRVAVPAPICPPWCDRNHDGFTAENGVLSVEHSAKRGRHEVYTLDIIDNVTAGVVRSTDLSAENTGAGRADGYEADTAADMAAQLRTAARELAALADALERTDGAA